MNAHHTQLLWDRYMQSYDFLSKVDGYVHSLEQITKLVGPQAHVLDAGSGTGNLVQLLQGGGRQVLGLDFSCAALRQHRRKDAATPLLRASLENPLPLSGAAFDCICCASVLFTLSESGRRTAISEFYRVLRCGGTAILTVAAPQQKNANLLRLHWDGLHRRHGRLAGAVHFLRDLPSLLRILHFNALLRKMPDNQGYHRVTKEEVLTLIETAGFELLEATRTYGGNFYLFHIRKPHARIQQQLN